MTLCERVRELDRLYLLHDSLCRRIDRAGNTLGRRRLEEEARAAWAEYVALRDSRQGLESLTPPR